MLYSSGIRYGTSSLGRRREKQRREVSERQRESMGPCVRKPRRACWKAESRLWKASRFVVVSSIKGDSSVLDVVSQSAHLGWVSGVLGRGMRIV